MQARSGEGQRYSRAEGDLPAWHDMAWYRCLCGMMHYINYIIVYSISYYISLYVVYILCYGIILYYIQLCVVPVSVNKNTPLDDIYIYIYTYIHISLSLSLSLPNSLSLYIYIYTCVHIDRYIYIYIYIHICYVLIVVYRDTGVCEKTLLWIRRQVGNSALEGLISGCVAVSAAGLHGKGLHKRNVLFTDAGSCTYVYAT